MVPANYPVHIQACRVTGSTVPGPTGASSAPGTLLYVAFTQQLRSDLLIPRDREPCLVFELNGETLSAGYYICRLAASYSGLPVYEAMSRASSGSGIVTINDNAVVNQTIGIGIDFTAPNNDLNISITPPPHEAGLEYQIGWMVEESGGFYWANAANVGTAPPGGPWTNVSGDGINILNFPRGRIYDPDSNFALAGEGSLAPQGMNFEFLTGGNMAISAAGGGSNAITFFGGAITINYININEFISYEENTFYFNEFNNNVYININNFWIQFCPCCDCEFRVWYCMEKDAITACYFVTAGELALMLIAGYAIDSGPHADQATCFTACSETAPTRWWCLQYLEVSTLCYELTDLELFALIDTGDYLPIGGPYADEADCTEACSGGPIQTACCAEAIPQTLTLTIVSGCGGTSPNTMTYSPSGPDGAGWYTAVEDVDGNDMYWALICLESNDWGLIKGCNGAPFGPVVFSALSCDPFDTDELTMPISGDCCSGAVDAIVTITE